MPDPISIATGVVGLLASIVKISIKLNELRSGISEARTEIDSFFRELGDLTNVLTRLQNSKALSRLPQSLSHDLVAVLKNCNETAEEAEILLLESSLSRFRGFYWVCTGKKELLRLCRGLEAHKATIVIILNFSSLQASSEIWDKMERFLSDIKDTRQRLPESDLTLRRFLQDTQSYAESIYEQSSATHVDDKCQQYQTDKSGDEFSYSMHLEGGTALTEIDQFQFPLSSHSHDFKSFNLEIDTLENYQDKNIIRGRYELLQTLPVHHRSGVSSVAFSSTGRQLASGSWDGSLVVWDLDTNSSLQSIHAHDENVTDVAFVGGEGLLASASSDRTIRFWDVNHGQTALQELSGHDDRIYSIAWSKNTGQLVSGSGDGTIRIWDIDTGSTLHILRSEGGGVWSIALTDDGRQLVSGSGDGTISIWDIRMRTICQSLDGHGDGVWSISLSRDTLASGSWDETVMLWDLRTESATHTLRGHEGRVTSIVHLNEGYLASGSGDEKTVKLWDTTTGSVVQTLEADGGDISCMAFSAESGGHLASGSGDKTVRLWEGI